MIFTESTKAGIKETSPCESSYLGCFETIVGQCNLLWNFSFKRGHTHDCVWWHQRQTIWSLKATSKRQRWRVETVLPSTPNESSTNTIFELLSCQLSILGNLCWSNKTAAPPDWGQWYSQLVWTLCNDEKVRTSKMTPHSFPELLLLSDLDCHTQRNFITFSSYSAFLAKMAGVPWFWLKCWL